MAKGFTYFFTDSDGNVYNRYSAGHTVARYVAATIVRPVGESASKHNISYGSKHPINDGAMEGVQNWYGEQRKVRSEVARVRAYPGRHASEPVS